MDINCDLGEGEPLRRTRALMRRITSANIACGGHAGDDASMRACLTLCREFQVRPGAHPGFEDRENFGRIAHPITPTELRALLRRQITALAGLSKRRLAHVKLHGALYHVVEKDARLARTYVRLIKEEFPHLRIFALAEGRVVSLARKEGVAVWGEVFAERGYLPDGGLVPRCQNGAVVEDLGEIRHRARIFVQTRQIITFSGTPRRFDAGTICVHSDTPGAVRIAGILADVFG